MSAYFCVKKIVSVRNQIPDEPIAQLINSLISSRLEYCNYLRYGMPEYDISRLQNNKNSAARILILKMLRWLPVKYRIIYKI